MRKYEKIVVYALVLIFILGIIWCCDKSVNYFIVCLNKKQHELKIDQGLGYGTSDQVINKKEIEDIKKDLLNK